MPETAFLRAFFPHGDALLHFVIRALKSDELGDLEDAMDYIDEDGTWPPDIRDDLQRLYNIRSFYNNGGLDSLEPEMQPEAKAYLEDADWKLTIELVLRILGEVPKALIGEMPVPPELAHLLRVDQSRKPIPAAEVVEERMTYQQ